MENIFLLIILIYSAIIHEYAHGWMADRLGDPTAKYAGRLTLNPLPHIDLFGSIIIPLLLFISKAGFIIGWAKPVPFNLYNLSDQKYGAAKVALAGPASNLILALLFGFLVRLMPLNNLTPLFSMIVYLNLLLMIFNLMPIPPLDGSRILAAFLPCRGQVFLAQLEPYGLIIILFFVYFIFGAVVLPILAFLFKIITTMNLFV
jgi:Zn-dependent protease